jgi:mRNA interferase RelE/StbE
MARLPVRIATAIMTFVGARLAENPARLSKPLHQELSGLRSARNGDYRVLIRVDDASEMLWVVRVHHRAHVYRSR